VKKNVFYVDAKTKIVDFLSTEFVDFSPKLQNRFLSFFPIMPNYEEEGERFRPIVLFTNNINAIAKMLPNPMKLELFDDENENMFVLRLKSLVPFCKHDWCIYIDVGEEGGHVTYGIITNISSLKDEGLTDLLFRNDTPIKTDKVSAILAYADNSYTVTMRSLSGNALITNFALDIMGHNDIDHEIGEFVEASFSKLKTTAKKLGELKNLYRNIFKNVLKEIRGTICVVIDKDCVHLYNKELVTEEEPYCDLLEDGIWLKEPIHLSKLFLKTDYFSEQVLKTLSDLFMTMLNMDGITVVDNSGRILAYNVFVEANHKTTGNIIGGARKRAAYTIINSRKKGIIGVYFQSYDGEIFFAQVKK